MSNEDNNNNKIDINIEESLDNQNPQNPLNNNETITLSDTKETSVADVVNTPVPITTSTEIEENSERENENDSSLFKKICFIILKPYFKLGHYFQVLIYKISEKIQIQSSYKYFLLFLALGLLFFFIALFYIPFFIFTPRKLLRLLSFGNIFIMLSFLFYYGSKDFFAFLIDENRTGVVISHLLGVCAGLFVSIFISGYFIGLFLDVVLIITTIMFILTLVPGGQGGIAGIKRMLLSPAILLFNVFKGKIFGESNSILPQ